MKTETEQLDTDSELERRADTGSQKTGKSEESRTAGQAVSDSNEPTTTSRRTTGQMLDWKGAGWGKTQI